MPDLDGLDVRPGCLPPWVLLLIAGALILFIIYVRKHGLAR